MGRVPDILKHEQYCSPCYTQYVLPALSMYNDVMSRAKNVFVIDKPRRRPLPKLAQAKEPLCIEDCDDEQEVLLRLAFQAAELGYNSVIKVNVSGKKVRNGGYQKMIWKATGYPAQLDGVRLERQSEEGNSPN